MQPRQSPQSNIDPTDEVNETKIEPDNESSSQLHTLNLSDLRLYLPDEPDMGVSAMESGNRLDFGDNEDDNIIVRIESDSDVDMDSDVDERPVFEPTLTRQIGQLFVQTTPLEHKPLIEHKPSMGNTPRPTGHSPVFFPPHELDNLRSRRPKRSSSTNPNVEASTPRAHLRQRIGSAGSNSESEMRSSSPSPRR